MEAALNMLRLSYLSLGGLVYLSLGSLVQLSLGDGGGGAEYRSLY